MDVNKLSELINIIPRYENIINIEGSRESAIMIPLVAKEDKLYILFEKRSQFVSQPGEICFPGGRIDDSDHNSEKAAVRETMEELGFDEKDITVLGKLGLLPNHHRGVLHCHVGFVQWQDVFLKRYNKDEVEEIMLVDIDTLMLVKPDIYSVKVKAVASERDEDGNKVTSFPAKKLGLPSSYHDEWSMGNRAVVSYDLKNIHIWGITGYILKYFIDLINDMDN